MCHRKAALRFQRESLRTCDSYRFLRHLDRLLATALPLTAMIAPTAMQGQQSRVPGGPNQAQICTLPPQDQAETGTYKLKTGSRAINTDDQAETSLYNADNGDRRTEADESDRLSVHYREGMLSVNSAGASLQAILDKIREQTGITVEASGDALQKKLFDKVGPAPLREALMSLLYGTGLNYIIQCDSTQQQSVRSLVLSPEAPDSPAASQQTGTVASNQPGENDAGAKTAEESANTTEIQPASPLNAQANPESVLGVPAGFDVQKAAADAKKTPGEILSELQRKQIEILDAQTPPSQ